MRRTLPLLLAACAATGDDGPGDDTAPTAAADTSPTAAPDDSDAPGVPRPSAGPDLEVVVGTPLMLRGRGGEASPLWDLGDGTQREGRRVTHTYAAPGNYVATFQATVDGRPISDTVRINAYLPPASRPPAASRALWVDEVHEAAWVALDDAGALIRVDLTTGEAAAVAPCDLPRSVAPFADGAVVACEGSGEVVAVNDDGGEAFRATLSDPPVAPTTVVRQGGAYWVGTRDGSLWHLDPPAEPARIATSVETRALVIDAGGRPWVPTARAVNQEARVDGPAGELVLARDPGPDSDTTNRGVFTNVAAAAIPPDGGTVFLGGTVANVDQGLWVERALDDPSPPTFESTLRATMRVIDVASRTERFADRRQFDNHGQVSAMAMSPRGNWLWVAHPGTHTLVRLDAYTGRTTQSILDAGAGITALQQDTHGALYVVASLDRELRVYDVADPTVTQPALIRTLPLLDVEPLPPAVLAGKRLFHDSRDRRLARDGYLACAACHPDGRDDGVVWDFTHRGEGLRNTITLEGRAGTGMGPVHWTGNFDEIQDFEGDIRNAQGGEGLLSEADWMASMHPLGAAKAGRSAELDALAAYVTSLATTPASPHPAPDGGAQAFEDAGCVACHPAPTFTDSALDVRHDVGSLTAASGQRLGAPLDGLDTPTLLGVWATAPYLHDGSAPSVAQAIRAHQGPDFDASSLDADTVRLIADYVRSL